MKLTRQTRDDLIDFLSLYLDEEDRHALVETAFHGSPLLEQVRWQGSTRDFTAHLLKTMLKYGEIERGRPAVMVLLETLEKQVGYDNREHIQQFLTELSLVSRPVIPSLATPASETKSRRRQQNRSHLPQIYIAAGHDARGFVESLAGYLDTARFAVADRLDQAIGVLLVITSDSLTQADIVSTWAFALGAGMPVMLLIVQPVSLPDMLSDCEQYDFSQGAAPWLNLIDRLRELVREGYLPGGHRRYLDFASLRHQLDQGSVRERLEAVTLLEKRGLLPLLDLLLLALNNGRNQVRASAAHKIIRMQHELSSLIARLIELLDDTTKIGRTKQVCDVAAEALEQIGTPEALAAVAHWRNRR